MERFKRALSLVLCVIMVFGLMPMNVFAATGSVIDAAIFCSDVHGNSSAVSSAFSGIHNADSAFDPSTATFVGDTQMAASSVTSAAQSVYSDVACYYAYGNHDSDGDYGISDVTGLLYSGENYYIYAISQTSMASSNPDTSGFTSTVAGLDKSKPLFIASHLPLHDRRGDSNGAAAWYEAISAAAESMDIVFFWAHNHTGENDVDREAFYVAKDGDETFTLENTSTVVTPNFTYMNAGFVGKSSSRGGVVTTVKIYSDAMVFQDYTSSGAFTGEYSHNVEVAREFANTTASGEDGSTEPTDPTETTAPVEEEQDTTISNGVHVEGTSGTTTAYVLTDSLTNNGKYLIVNTNAAGSGYAMNHSSGTEGTVAVNIVAADSGNYIVLDDSTAVWTATTKSSGFELMNGSYYLEAYGNTSAIEISTTQEYSARYWNYTDSALGYYGGNSTHYIYYSDGFVSAKNSGSEAVYLYQEQTISTSTSGTYYLDAKDVTTISALSDSTTASLNSVITFVEDGSTTAATVTDLGGTYTYDINDNTSGIIDSVSDDGVVTINPNVTGTATVDVTYTWTVDGTEYSMTDTATIKVTGVVDQGVVDGYTSTTTGTVPKNVYVLVSTPTAGNQYIIVSSGSAGSGYALKENTTTGTSVSINAATDSISNPWIETSDEAIMWNATSGLKFQSENGGYYLNYSNSQGSYRLSFSTSSGSDWTAGTNQLYRNGQNNDYWLRYNNGWTMGGSGTTYNVYFYEAQTVDVETTVETTGTVSLEAGDPITCVVSGETDIELDPAILFAGQDATSTFEALGGVYTVEYVSGDEIITSTDGLNVTLNGTYGTATVRVKYTWTVGGNTYAVWDTVTVTATSPYYTLDLHQASYTFTEVSITEFEAGVTYYIKNTDGTYTVADSYVDETQYYTATANIGAEITAPIAIKGVEKGDTYSVWAVIKEFDGVIENGEDGKDLGDVPDDQILWVSSDTSIATVDPATGIITFTGKDGSVTITAYYLDEEGKVRAEDSVDISVTQTQYTVPEDGTDDFPEYPKQGAIRHDKYATAVGSFSQTGVAKVELSMTGVPYGTSAKTDVVIMVDMTASMSDDDVTAAEAAVKELIQTLVYDEENDVYDSNIQLFVDVFYSASSDDSFTTEEYLNNVTVSNSTELTAVLAEIDFTQSKNGGGTRYNLAMADVYGTLTRDGHADNQFVVFVSDGVATAYSPLTDGKLGTTITGENSETKSLAAGWFDDEGEVTSEFETEYYSYMIKSAGIPIYTVGCNLTALSDAADLLNHMSSNYSPDGKTSTGQTKYSFFTTTSGGITDATLEIFRGIGMDIKEAARDVIVADQITPEYTMIFDIPTGTVKIDDTLAGQEFYIEVMDYPMNAVYASDGTTITDYVRGTGTSLIKLYLGEDNGTYYAASDAAGTRFADPEFGQTAIGSMFYWTTDATDTGISVTVDGTTYYFDKVGASNEEEDFDETKWFNMTAGAYAYGTINSTNTSTDLIIATPYFAYNASTRMLYWTAEKLSSNELTISYFLYLNNSATEVGEAIEADPATYPTNVGATITYTNFKDTRCQQEFPIPQLTWKGAQVSYVFYLVNAAGQPVNRAGKVVPFSEAVYVTNTYTHSVVWNKETGVTSLNAAQLAEKIVPEVYTLYDTAAYYEINVYQNTGDGKQDHFIIEGGSGVTNKETTKVFNTKSDADHRYSKYGAYSNVGGTYTSTNSGKSYPATTTTGFDYCNTTVAFAVLWTPVLKEDVVVVDYGLDVVIDVTANDAVASGVVGVMASKRSDVTMNTGTYDDAAKAQSVAVMLGTTPLATARVESMTSVRFTLNEQYGMEFSDAAEFYYESDVNYYDAEEVLHTTTMYSSVTVIPATTIYYEDDFVTYESQTWDGGWKNVDANSDKYVWSLDGSPIADTQAQDRPGEQGNVTIGSGLDADNIYGYDGAYAEMNTYSNGSAMKAAVDYDNRGIATFDFWGTGFDVISLTSNATGTIYLEVWDASNELVVDTVVDTYYGYTRALYNVTYKYLGVNVGTEKEPEYEYQWVMYTGEPAEGTTEIKATFPEDPEDGATVTGVEYIWIVDPDASNSLYQVPVIQANDLTYGKYTARIIVGYNPIFDHVEGSTSYDFYLDAIRIYDPANDGEGKKDAVGNAYAADHEGWPSYIELRDNLIKANAFEQNVAGTEIKGMVFIDGDASVDSDQLSDYISYGPNNEVYLAPNQQVAFKLATPDNIDRIHLGIKSADGPSATYTIKNIDADGNAYNVMTATVKTTTDLYLDITDYQNDIVVISNAGAGIVSITNIKSTYTSKPTTETQEVQAQSLEDERFETYIYMTAEAAAVTLKAMEPKPVNPFADIQAGQFFYESVLWAVKNGITNGVDATHFGPYINCNRAQVVTFLWRAAGSPAPESRVNPFTDVPENSWYTDAVLWAVENGITNGLTATTFGPTALCNRAQVVTFLWRANGSKVIEGAANPFADVAEGAFYHNAVVWAVQNGITTGATATTFNPTGICMRAHVVTFLYRAEQLADREVNGVS